MKTSIRRLENMGLNEEQIRKVLGWDEVTYFKRKKYPSNQFNVEDLPQKIDAVVKGYNVDDLKKVKLFDEIFAVNGLDKSNEDNSYKIDMITEFPKLLKHIKMSRIKSEIEEIEEAKRKLLIQMAELDSQVSIKQTEMSMLNASVETEPVVEEPTEQEEKELVVLDTFEPKIMRVSKSGNMFLSVKVVVIDLVKEGDYVLFQDKKYVVTATNRRGCNMYINPVKEDVEPIEVAKPTEPVEHKTLTESDIRIDYVAKNGLNVCIKDANLYNEVKHYDEVKLAREGKLELYKVKNYNDRMRRINITFVETILENKSYDREEEKARFKFW